MRFESRSVFTSQQDDAAIAADLAFLVADPALAPAALRAASCSARAAGVTGSRWLIAEGRIGAGRFYRGLSRHLGVAFVDGWPALAAGQDVTDVHRSGRVRLADGTTWLTASCSGAS